MSLNLYSELRRLCDAAQLVPVPAPPVDAGTPAGVDARVGLVRAVLAIDIEQLLEAASSVDELDAAVDTAYDAILLDAELDWPYDPPASDFLRAALRTGLAAVLADPATGHPAGGGGGQATRRAVPHRALEQLALLLNRRYAVTVARFARQAPGSIVGPYLQVTAPVAEPGIVLEIWTSELNPIPRFQIEAYTGPPEQIGSALPFAKRELVTLDDAIGVVAAFIPPPDAYAVAGGPTGPTGATGSGESRED